MATATGRAQLSSHLTAVAAPIGVIEVADRDIAYVCGPCGAQANDWRILLHTPTCPFFAQSRSLVEQFAPLSLRSCTLCRRPRWIPINYVLPKDYVCSECQPPGATPIYDFE